MYNSPCRQSIFLNIFYYVIFFGSILSLLSYTPTKSPSSIKSTSKYSSNSSTFFILIFNPSNLHCLLPQLLHHFPKSLWHPFSFWSIQKGKYDQVIACLKFFNSFPLLLDKIQNPTYHTEFVWSGSCSLLQSCASSHFHYSRCSSHREFLSDLLPFSMPRTTLHLAAGSDLCL